MKSILIAWRRNSSAILSRLLAVAAVLTGVYVAADTIATVILTYSALPYWDQWDSLMDYQLYRQGVASLHLLFETHNEHRLALPRLLFLADYEWAAGTNKLNLALVSVVQLIHVGLLLSLIRHLWREASTWIAGAAVLALMMSMGQWQNFTWGFQGQFVGVFTLATGGFMLTAKAVDQNGVRRAALFSIALLMFFLATFTMANGLLTAAIALALCLVIGAPWWMSAALVAYLAGASLFYFHDYSVVTSDSNVLDLLRHPWRYALYCLSYLGNPLGELLLWQARSQPARLYPAATLLGVTGAILALLVALRVVLCRGADRGQAVLAAIMLFVLVSIALTGSGRINFGLEQAYSSRYRAASGLFWAAQILFWFRTFAGDRRRNLVAAASIGALAAMVWVQVAIKPDIYDDAAARRLAESAVLGQVIDLTALEGAFPRAGIVYERAKLLRAYRKSIYAQDRADWLGSPLDKIGPSRAGRCLGALDSVSRTERGVTVGLRASGWAWDSKAHWPVRDVVLTDDALRVVGVGRSGTRRPDVRAALRTPWAAGAGWQAMARFPSGTLHAFGVLKDGGVCALGNMIVAEAPRGKSARP